MSSLEIRASEPAGIARTGGADWKCLVGRILLGKNLVTSYIY